MFRAFVNPLLALSLATLATGCGSSSSGSTVSPTGIPSAETLCKLTPNISTATDVRTLLGVPWMSETVADGTSTFLYDYDPHAPNATVAILQFWFTPAQVFSSATVSNLDMPSCWQFDGGL